MRRIVVLILSITAGFGGTELANAETIEVVIFNSKHDMASEEVINRAENMRKTMNGWPGFMGRSLVRTGSDQWIDIVSWRDLESAMLAQEKAMVCKPCLSFFDVIDERSQHLYHGEVLLQQAKPLGHPAADQ